MGVRPKLDTPLAELGDYPYRADKYRRIQTNHGPETAANSIRNKAVAGLVIETVAGEPRILDIDLAKRLGFAKPVKIRDLIKRHRVNLEVMGTLPTVGRDRWGGVIATVATTSAFYTRCV